MRNSIFDGLREITVNLAFQAHTPIHLKKYVPKNAQISPKPC